MEVSTEFRPYFIFFPPIASTTYQPSYSHFTQDSSNIFWSFCMPSSVPNYEIARPQITETTRANIQTNEVVLHTQEPAVFEVQRRSPRRSRNKRLRNTKKQLQSAKKNSESNIVNQLYSFFNCYEKSQNVVQKAIRLLKQNQSDFEKIKSVFYNTVRLINLKRGRKYVNKDSILSYYTPQNFRASIPEICNKLDQVKLLTLEQLCLLFRVTTAYFIRSISVMAILTSKRITMVARYQHLQRRRKVFSSLSCQTLIDS